jgi:ankyrin repeat protein
MIINISMGMETFMNFLRRRTHKCFENGGWYIHDEEEVCMVGNLERFKSMRINYLNDCLFIALEYGHVNIAKYIVKIGAKEHYNYALYWASRGGHMESIRYILLKGARNLNGGLLGACHNGHIDIADYFIKKGASNLDEAFEEACQNNNTDILDYLIEKGANNFENGFVIASEYGKMDLVKYFIDKRLIGNISEIINSALCGACLNGHIDMVNYLVENGANDFEGAFEDACYGGHLDMVEYIVENYGANNFAEIIQEVFIENRYVIEYLEECIERQKRIM